MHARGSPEWQRVLAFVRGGVSPETALAIAAIGPRNALRLLYLAGTGAQSRKLGEHAADLREALAFSRGKVETDLKAAKPLEWLQYQRELLAEAAKLYHRRNHIDPMSMWRLLGELQERLQTHPELRSILLDAMATLPRNFHPRRKHAGLTPRRSPLPSSGDAHENRLH
jgi:hypothetical protein